MTDAEAESARLKLIGALAETAQMLRRCGESHWAERLDDSRSLVEGRDFRGVEQTFSFFGGMGSFNDLLIHPANGHTISEADLEGTNQTLRALQTEIYELVTDLRRYESAP